MFFGQVLIMPYKNKSLGFTLLFEYSLILDFNVQNE